MTSPNEDDGLIAVLMERFEKQRLSRALDLKELVDRGELLSELDITFLEEVFADASKVKPLIDRHPEYQELATRMIGLYKEITAKGLENQKAAD